MKIRSLREDDDRAGFRSGDPDLDRFFIAYAGQNQFKHHLGVTYVAVENARVMGFATVAPAHLEIEKLPSGTRKSLPKYPLPVLRLARLAIDESARGQGLGTRLLRYILQLALRMAREYGCTGVLVDVKPGAVDFYAKHGFIPLDVTEGQLEARPRTSAMFLSIRAIALAEEG